ncbi:MAG TPA: HTH domain-containing protein [Allocoleopsis sp.]
MDPVKEAFAKAKQDISLLRQELEILKLEIAQLRSSLSINPTPLSSNQTNKHNYPTNIPTDIQLNELNVQSSIGNEGVPTNKQTNQQTNQQTNLSLNDKIHRKIDLTHAIETFDSLKEQLRSKFSSLTRQEMSVFVAIYILEEQKKTVDYATIANHLGLTETSIRDYILKMTKKGIPLIKTKQNNKKIILSVDPSLKKIAPLSSLFALREPITEH